MSYDLVLLYKFLLEDLLRCTTTIDCTTYRILFEPNDIATGLQVTVKDTIEVRLF